MTIPIIKIITHPPHPPITPLPKKKSSSRNFGLIWRLLQDNNQTNKENLFPAWSTKSFLFFLWEITSLNLLQEHQIMGLIIGLNLLKKGKVKSNNERNAPKVHIREYVQEVEDRGPQTTALLLEIIIPLSLQPDMTLCQGYFKQQQGWTEKRRTQRGIEA